MGISNKELVTLRKLLQACVDSCNNGSQIETDRIAPATKTRGETVQRWKMVKTPCHTSSQQLSVAAGCPGPSQRRSDLHCRCLPTIQNWHVHIRNCWTLKLGFEKLLAQKETYYRLIHLPLSILLVSFLFSYVYF